MLFKGTKARSTFDIAWIVDSIGGVMNAYTGKELTSFYLKIPDYHLSLALDLLADIFQNPLFDEEEMEKEKTVICQEISMLEDTPEDYIHDFFDTVFWDSHPLGLPILGTKKGVMGLTIEELKGFFYRKYRGENLIVAAAGNLKHGAFLSLVEKAFGSLRGAEKENLSFAVNFVPRYSVLEKKLEQVHILIGTPAPSAVSPRRYAAMVLNALLGGAMSSRLFQEIREKRGLAYDVQSYLTPYAETGMLGVYVGTESQKVPEVLRVILENFRFLTEGGVSEKELKMAKEMLKGNLLLGMENTDQRMNRLARNEFYFQRQVPLEEVLSSIDAVTRDEVKALAEDLLNPERMSAAAIGCVSPSSLDLRNYG